MGEGVGGLVFAVGDFVGFLWVYDIIIRERPSTRRQSMTERQKHFDLNFVGVAVDFEKLSGTLLQNPEHWKLVASLVRTLKSCQQNQQ